MLKENTSFAAINWNLVKNKRATSPQTESIVILIRFYNASGIRIKIQGHSGGAVSLLK